MRGLRFINATVVLAMAVNLAGCATTGLETGGAMLGADPVQTMRAKLERFKDVKITVDPRRVSETDRAVLGHLLKAAEIMDDLFWKQAGPDGQSALAIINERLARNDELAQILRDYITINYGVWDRLDHFQPFYGTRERPKGATFYPEDMTTEEFEAWIAAHPEDREAFLDTFTVIRRDGDRLVAVKYADLFGKELRVAAEHLRTAAKTTTDRMLAKYLNSRADAFESNDYFQSDMDWMDLGTGDRGTPSMIEVTIGPYEVYEDGLMNLKGAFEAFVTLEDPEQSALLARVSSLLDKLEANLPIEDCYKNFSRGKASPIKVVNVVMTAGDSRAGVQTTAFNLPNDERVRTAKGSKKVMLLNVSQAKFENSLIPISKMIVAPKLLPDITFDAYFNFILLHEVSHGLGPGRITTPDGTRTTVNLALRDTYSAIEECKADTLSVFNTLYLIKQGIFEESLRRHTMATYLPGLFRSVRFGISEAHGKSNIMQFNFLYEAKAITWDEQTGLFNIDADRFEPAIRDLATRLLMIQARGDYDSARAFMSGYGSIPPEVADALARLNDVPVDIRPHYPWAEQVQNSQ